MARRWNPCWLNLAINRDGAYVIRDCETFHQLIGKLREPSAQNPRMSLFIGGKRKDEALLHIFPYNNLKRIRSHSSVSLRWDVSSLESMSPLLFAESNLFQHSNPCQFCAAQTGTVHPITWRASSEREVLCLIYSRLIFLFADVVCIFEEDFPDTHDVVDFLITCQRAEYASSLPSSIRPRLIVVLNADKDRSKKKAELIQKLYNSGSLSECFSALHTFELPTTTSASCQRLRTLILGQLDDMQQMRRECRTLFNATQMAGFVELAMEHVTKTVERPFDFVRATRKRCSVSSDLPKHLAHYQEIGAKAGFSNDELAPSIASALLMDHYQPGMPCK